MASGYKYTWGKSTEKVYGTQDCSSFTQAAFAKAGVNIGRDTIAQWNNSKGMKVPKDNLKPGDLVFFQNTYRKGISHVGIYAGNGKFINNSSSKGKVVIADMNDGYWGGRYYGAKRITT